MPRKRAKTPKKKQKKKEEDKEKKDWSNVLGGLSQDGNSNFIYHFLQPDDKVDLMETSKEQKNFVLNTTSEEEIDDGRFIKAWNKPGIQNYYYSVPYNYKNKEDEGKKQVIFIIPKAEQFSQFPPHTPNGRFIPGEFSNMFYPKFNYGILNKLYGTGYVMNDFKRFYLMHQYSADDYDPFIFLFYEFPLPLPNTNPIVGGLLPINVIADVAIRNDNNEIDETFDSILTYDHILKRRQPQIVSDIGVGEEHNNVELNKAYMAECKKWFREIYLNNEYEKVLIGKKQGVWERFKKSTKEVFDEIAKTCEPLGSCVISGGKKTKKKRKRKKTKRKRKKRKKRKKTRKRRKK